MFFGGWLSLVEHYVRDVGVVGSNPATPTNKKATLLGGFFTVSVWELKPRGSRFIFDRV